MKYLTNIDLNKNQLMNAVGHKLATAPSNPVEGQEYYDTVLHKKFYFNGTDWIEQDGLEAMMTGADIVTAINGSTSKIDDDNLSANVNTAITNSHTHTNMSVLNNTTASYTTELNTILNSVEENADVTDATNVGSAIHGTTGKTTPVNADTVAIINSEASNTLAKVTWANIKATLKTYFDTLYNNYSHPNHTGDVTSTGDGATVITNNSVTNTKLADMATNTIKGRKTTGTGDPEDLSASDVRTILNIEDGANNYVHPNHSGDVTSTGDGATVIGDDKVTNAKLANMPTMTIKGNNTASTADPTDLTATEVRALLNVENGAQVNTVTSVAGKQGVVSLTSSDVGLGNVTNNAQIKKSTSSVNGNIPTWNGTTGDALNSGYSVETTLTGSTSAIPRADAVKTYVDSLLGANDAMIYKGTLGTGGTITALPTTYDVGWTYKVISAGTYAGNVCQAGDMVIAIVGRTGSGNQNTDWTVVQANIDGAVTGPTSSTNGNFPVFDGATGKVIKNSTYSPSSFATASHNHDSIYPKKYTTTLGGSTSQVITHNLNTRDLTVTIRETASPYAIVYTDVELTTVNTITVKFAETPTSNQYTITIIG